MAHAAAEPTQNYFQHWWEAWKAQLAETRIADAKQQVTAHARKDLDDRAPNQSAN